MYPEPLALDQTLLTHARAHAHPRKNTLIPQCIRNFRPLDQILLTCTPTCTCARAHPRTKTMIHQCIRNYRPLDKILPTSDQPRKSTLIPQCIWNYRPLDQILLVLVQIPEPSRRLH